MVSSHFGLKIGEDQKQTKGHCCQEVGFRLRNMRIPKQNKKGLRRQIGWVLVQMRTEKRSSLQSFAKVSNHMCKNAKMAFFQIFANFIGWQYIFVLFIAEL